MAIQTAGQLRTFLANAMTGVTNGDLSTEKASQVVKLAEQITGSIYSEMKLQSLQMQAGKHWHQLGHTPLGEVGDSTKPTEGK